jgi:hypothetical protein
MLYRKVAAAKITAKAVSNPRRSIERFGFWLIVRAEECIVGIPKGSLSRGASGVNKLGEIASCRAVEPRCK